MFNSINPDSTLNHAAWIQSESCGHSDNSQENISTRGIYCQLCQRLIKTHGSVLPSVMASDCRAWPPAVCSGLRPRPGSAGAQHALWAVGSDLRASFLSHLGIYTLAEGGCDIQLFMDVTVVHLLKIIWHPKGSTFTSSRLQKKKKILLYFNSAMSHFILVEKYQISED